VYSIAKEFASVIIDKGLPVPRSTYVGCRTLTLLESLFEYKSLPKFDPATSKGMRLRKWKINKRELLAGNKDVVLEFSEKMKPILEAFSKGEYSYQLCADKLKDELRDLERVSQMKTRIFNVADFVDNVLIKMALGDLVEKTKKLYMFAPAACGTDPGSSAWRMLFERFNGLDVLCSDIKAFDHTATPWIMIVLEVLVVRCYPSVQDRKFAMWAFWACMMAVRFNAGHGRFMARGNSSGN